MGPMTDDLVAFLRARLDQDAAVAQAATPGPWRHDEAKHWRKPGTSWFEEAVFAGPSGEEATCVAGTGETDDQQSMRDAAHIARHDPARVLADVEAKRELVERYEASLKRSVEFRQRADSDAETETQKMQRSHENIQLLVLLGVVKLLALPYADHPDYREDWRP